MRCYILQNNQVVALSAAPSPLPKDAILLQKPTDLDAKRFPTGKLAAIWNRLPGVKPVQRFKDRKSAVARIWAMLQKLPLAGASGNSKQAQVLGLMQAKGGAALDELMAATGWQAHSVRGLISQMRKKGLKVELVKDGNDRRYQATA